MAHQHPTTARRLRRCHAAVVALALLAPAALPAQISIPLGGPKKVKPSPNANLLGAPVDVAAAVAARGRPGPMRELDESAHPVEVLDYLGLTRGVRVLVVERDLGYFGAIIGAALGPDGRVTELVPPTAMQDPAIRATMSDAISLAPSLSILAAAPLTARLTPASLDLVLLYRTPLLANPAAAFFAKLFAAVRPGGIVGVVGGGADEGDAPAGDAAGVIRDVTHAGFVLDSSGHIRGDDGVAADAAGDRRRYILKFLKPE